MPPNLISPPDFRQTPSLPMRGVPESVTLMASPNQMRLYTSNSIVNNGEGLPPPSTEELSRFRKTGRFLTTPLSLFASRFSPQTAPKAWDIVQQKAEWSFQDVLRDRGATEKEARWLGFALDMVLDPLNFVSFVGLTKFGKAQRALSNASDLKKALPGALKSFPGLDDSTAVGRLLDETIDIGSAEERARRAHVGRVMGADLERGVNWYDQAAKTQRAALMMNIPFAPALQGIPILPKQVSMMAFAVPTTIRKLFTGGANLIKVPRTPGKTLADVIGTAIRRGSGNPMIDKGTFIFRRVMQSRDAAVISKVIRPLVEDLKKINFDDWQSAIAKVERREIKDLLDTKMAVQDFIKAGFPKELLKKPQFIKIMQSLKKNMEIAYDTEKLNKLPIAKYADDIDYITHLLTKDAVQLLGKSKQMGSSPRMWTTNHGNFIRRKWRNLTIKEVNDLGRKGQLPGYRGVIIKKTLEDNPIALIAARLHHAVRAVTGAQMLRFVGKGLGREVSEVASAGRLIQLGAQRLKAKEVLDKLRAPGAFNVKAVAVARKKLDGIEDQIAAAKTLRRKELADIRGEGFATKSASPYMADFRFKSSDDVMEMDRHFARLTEVEAVSDFARYYDSVFNFLKGITLAPFPAYHARNMIDNLWRNYLAGINPISYYYARIALRHLDKKGMAGARGKSFRLPNGETITLEELANEMQLLAVVGHNARDAEFLVENADRAAELITSGKMAKLKNVVNPDVAKNTVIKFGFDIGRQFVENPARAAHYIGKRLKGESPYDAALSVKKYLFDYADMNDFERQVLRRTFFFWSFMSNNIPFQIEQIFRKPGKIGKLFIAERSKIIPDLLKRNSRELESRFLSEWVREGAPFFMGRDPDDPDKFRYLMLDGWNSTFDLQKLFDPGRLFVNSLTPFLKEPFQQAANWDFFYKRPITSMPNISDTFLIREDFLGVSGPRRIVHVLRNIRMFSELDRLIKVGQQSPNKAFEIGKRLALGGSGIQVSQARGAVDLGFRLQRMMITGRKEYTRALRRDRPEEANDILQDLIVNMTRGFQ